MARDVFSYMSKRSMGNKGSFVRNNGFVYNVKSVSFLVDSRSQYSTQGLVGITLAGYSVLLERKSRPGSAPEEQCILHISGFPYLPFVNLSASDLQKA